MALLAGVFGLGTAQATTYADRPTFLGAIGNSVTDDYSNPGYDGIFPNIRTDVVMSAVLGETDYVTTGFLNHNMVLNGQYCSGCNGSFLLDFTSTTVGSTSGVFGVGLDITSESTDYFAFTTFGDNSTAEFSLVNLPFFGITNSRNIRSIHFGLSGGESSTSGGIQIDNLTIGAASQAIPEPSSLLLLGAGLVGLAAWRWKRTV